MKKTTAAVATLFMALTSIPAMADSPVHYEAFRFACPNASGGMPSNRLINYGTSISGRGKEKIGKNEAGLPLFSGVPSSGVPMDLSTGAYSHAGTLYNAHSGNVTCLFTSSNGSASFNVSFKANNIKNGIVDKSNNSDITVYVFQGLK